MSSRPVLVDAAALEQLVLAAAASQDQVVREALGQLVRTGTAPAPPSRPWLSVADAATRFGVSERTVRRAAARGDWTHRRVGRRLLVAANGPDRTRADTPVDGDTGTG